LTIALHVSRFEIIKNQDLHINHDIYHIIQVDDTVTHPQLIY
jgi:hypothetical protein